MRELSRLLTPRLRENAGLWVLVGLLVAIQALSFLATPVYYKLIFDRVIGKGDVDTLVILLIGMGAAFAVMVATGLGQSALCADLGMRAINAIRLDLLQSVLGLPVDYLSRVRAGDVLTRFGSDMGAVERFVTLSLYKTTLNTLVTLLCVAALFFIEWRLAVFTLIMLPAVTLIPRAVGARAALANRARAGTDGRVTSAVQETLGAHDLIRAFSLEASHLRRFGDLLGVAFRAGRRTNLLGMLVEQSSNLGLILGQLVVVSLGAYLVTRGFLTAGDIIAFIGLLLNASGAVAALTVYLPDWIQAAGAAQRLNELLAESPGHEATGTVEAPRFHREIRLCDVSFSYGDNKALDGLSFGIRAGESVALVGRSGSGKSTVLNLLMRFYDPDSGAITLDDVDFRSLTPASLRAQMGCVFQTTYLFNMSVRDNIRQGRLDASDPEVEEAARAAMIHDAILALPQGYDTALGDSGTRLSGGQRQRLAIARAILRHPAILILDEATAALDPATEAAVNETFAALARDCTLISVTHRLAVACAMNRILVFDQGKLVEEGAHEDLMRQGGLYRALWDKQTNVAVDATGTRASLNAQFLRTVPIFEDLDDRVLSALAGQFGSELRPSDATVIEQGETGATFYVIVRGRVEVIRTEGERTTSWVLEDGDFFGEIALLKDAPRSATVRTIDRCLLLTLNRVQFDAALAETPGLHARLMEIAARRLSTTDVAVPVTEPIQQS